MTVAQSRCPASSVEARCVRLLAKADNAGSLAPVVERHTLSRGRMNC